MARKKYVGYREYAKIKGVALSSVQTAIKAGRIDTAVVKGIKKIDWKLANKQWEENTSTDKSPYTIPDNQKMRGPTFQQSRAIREAYQARLAKLDYEQKIEKLIDADIVKRQAFELGRRIRDAFLNIPARISNELLSAEESFDIEQILNREFDEVLKNLVKGK